MSTLSDLVKPRKSHWLFLGFFLCGQVLALAPCEQVANARAQKILRGPGDEPFGVPRYQRRFCEKEWTVLVYMAADNNLSDFAKEDLLEMESPVWDSDLATATSSHIDVITQLDTLGDEGVSRRQMYSYEKIAEQKNQVLSPILETLPEHNSADAKNLREFLQWGQKNFPSKRTMLVIWGHGQGWTSGAGVYGGVAFDDESKSRMSIQSMSKVLHQFVKEDRDGKGIDVLASDACLMQSFEVVAEMAGDFKNLKTQPIDFVVGSTEKQSALGLPYHSILHYLNELYRAGSSSRNTDLDSYLLASRIPFLTKQNLDGGHLDPDAERKLTLSSISIAQFKQSLIPQFYNFSRALHDNLLEDTNDLFEVLHLTQGLMAYEGGNRDVGAWAQLMDNYFQAQLRESHRYRRLAKAVSELREALSATVIATSFGSRYVDSREQLYLLGYKAMSLWLPEDLLDYQLRRKDFLNSKLYSFIPEGKVSNPWLDLQDYLYGYQAPVDSIQNLTSAP